MLEVTGTAACGATEGPCAIIEGKDGKGERSKAGARAGDRETNGELAASTDFTWANDGNGSATVIATATILFTVSLNFKLF
jgi:hypothetical protein